MIKGIRDSGHAGRSRDKPDRNSGKIGKFDATNAHRQHQGDISNQQLKLGLPKQRSESSNSQDTGKLQLPPDIPLNFIGQVDPNSPQKFPTLNWMSIAIFFASLVPPSDALTSHSSSSSQLSVFPMEKPGSSEIPINIFADTNAYVDVEQAHARDFLSSTGSKSSRPIESSEERPVKLETPDSSKEQPVDVEHLEAPNSSSAEFVDAEFLPGQDSNINSGDPDFQAPQENDKASSAESLDEDPGVHEESSCDISSDVETWRDQVKPKSEAFYRVGGNKAVKELTDDQIDKDNLEETLQKESVKTGDQEQYTLKFQNELTEQITVSLQTTAKLQTGILNRLEEKIRETLENEGGVDPRNSPKDELPNIKEVNTELRDVLEFSKYQTGDESSQQQSDLEETYKVETNISNELLEASKTLQNIQNLLCNQSDDIIANIKSLISQSNQEISEKQNEIHRFKKHPKSEIKIDKLQEELDELKQRSEDLNDSLAEAQKNPDALPNLKTSLKGKIENIKQNLNYISKMPHMRISEEGTDQTGKDNLKRNIMKIMEGGGATDQDAYSQDSESLQLPTEQELAKQRNQDQFVPNYRTASRNRESQLQ